jgi:hypothetical protein
MNRTTRSARKGRTQQLFGQVASLICDFADNDYCEINPVSNCGSS